MERFVRGKAAPVVSLLLVIAVGMLLGITKVNAQQTDAIAPDQGFEIINLLQLQSATVSVTQTSMSGSYTVYVNSFNNRSLSGGLSPAANQGALGWWAVMALGTGRTYVDFAFGLLPWGGQKAIVDLYDPYYFGVIITYVFLTVMPEDGSFSYTISIGQS